MLARRLLLEAHDGGHLRVHLPYRPDRQRAGVGEVRRRAGVPTGFEALRERRSRSTTSSSLELGGSNDIANLYPEKATLPAGAPGFHVKDKLENKLHDLVCDGAMSLRSVQRQIAANWQALYKKVFGVGAERLSRP